MRGTGWWGWAIAAVAIVGVLAYGLLSQRTADKLRATGLPATGRVLGARQTGTWVNNNPEVALELEVARDGVAPYRTTLTVVVPQLNLSAVQPGATLRLRVAAGEPTRAVVDEPWAR